jgi:hypothetical protein
MQIEERTVAAGTGKRSGEGSEEVAGRGIALATLNPHPCGGLFSSSMIIIHSKVPFIFQVYFLIEKPICCNLS